MPDNSVKEIAKRVKKWAVEQGIPRDHVAVRCIQSKGGWIETYVKSEPHGYADRTMTYKYSFSPEARARLLKIIYPNSEYGTCAGNVNSVSMAALAPQWEKFLDTNQNLT